MFSAAYSAGPSAGLRTKQPPLAPHRVMSGRRDGRVSDPESDRDGTGTGIGTGTVGGCRIGEEAAEADDCRGS